MRSNRFTQLFLAVVIISGLVVGLAFYQQETTISLVAGIISISSTVLGAITFWIQLRKDSKINQANFIIKLQRNFFEFKLVGIKNKLYAEMDESKYSESDIAELSSYVAFFENMAPMIFDGVLTLDLIDDLFSFNFFLCTNHPVCKKIKIIPHADGWRGIFRLHKVWTAFKKKKGQPILMEETSLDVDFPDYELYARAKQPKTGGARL